MKFSQSQQGLTLAELLVYAGVFAITAGLLTTILIIVVNTQKRETASTEVTQQLNLVLNTASRLVSESSLVEAVYEGADASSTCTTFCTLKLRRIDLQKDPTVISSDINGIYLKEGNNAITTLSTNKVIINSLKFTKYETPGGHAVAEVRADLTYNSTNPKFALRKTLASAITRVSAATFDSDLIPNQDNAFDVGQLGSNLRWKNGRFSGDLTVGGQIQVSGGSPGIGKVLTSDAAGLASWQAAAGLPSGAVMFFNLSTCPSGWTDYSSAQGRYLVGKLPGGTLGATVGTAFTVDQENRAVGQHNHPITDPGHTHNLKAGGVGGAGGSYTVNPDQPAVPGFIANATTGITVNATGTVTGTNAPYIQLLACQKS